MKKGAKLGPVSIFTRCKVFLCGPVQSVPTWSRPVPFITALPMGLSRSSSILGFFKAGYVERLTDSVQLVTGKAPRSFAQYAKDYRASWLG